MLQEKIITLKKGEYRKVGKYPIAVAGQAVIWKVQGIKDKKYYALKTVNPYDPHQPSKQRDDSIIEKLIEYAQAEIDFLRSLENAQQHFIVTYLDHGFIEFDNFQLPRLLMPLYQQCNLSCLINKINNKQFPLKKQQWFLWFKQLISAVQYFQPSTELEQPLIHRDIKPANCLLDDKNNLFLTDFGILKKSNKITISADATPTYCAPEQLLAQSIDPEGLRRFNITSAIDIYTTALILYEIIAGRTLAQKALGDDLKKLKTKHEGNVPRTKDIRTGKISELGKTGGLNEDEVEHFKRKLSALLNINKPKSKKESGTQENTPLPLPNHEAINTSLVALFQQMLSPWPDDRPNATEVLTQILAIEQSLQPILTRLDLTPKKSSLEKARSLPLAVTLEGKGFPQDFKWLKVTINNQPVSGLHPTLVTDNPKKIQLNVPPFEQIGNYTIKISAVVNDKLYTSEVHVQISPTANELWLAGKREQALQLDLKISWLNHWEKEATINNKREALLKVLKRLQTFYAKDQVSSKRLMSYWKRLDSFLEGKVIHLQKKRYQVLERLSTEGIITIWKVKGATDAQYYALKTITYRHSSPHFSPKPNSPDLIRIGIAYMQTEINFLSSVKQPTAHCIVPYLDSGIIQRGEYQIPCLLTPLYQGNLTDVSDSKNNPLFTGSQWLIWFKQLMTALRSIQQENTTTRHFIHCKIHAASCFLDKNHDLFLGNFIRVRQGKNETSQSLATQIEYRVKSCAPEQVLAQSINEQKQRFFYLTPAIDIYASALTLVTLIIGKIKSHQNLENPLLIDRHNTEVFLLQNHQGKVAYLGEIGGLEEDEEQYLKRQLLALFKSIKSPETTTDHHLLGVSSLPNYNEITTLLVALLQTMLAPWPNDRPTATGVLEKLKEIEVTLYPKLSLFKIISNVASVNITEHLKIEVLLKGEGLPTDVEWIQVTVNDKRIEKPIILNLDAQHIVLKLPLFSDAGKHTIKIASVVNNILQTDTMVISVTPLSTQIPWNIDKQEESLDKRILSSNNALEKLKKEKEDSDSLASLYKDDSKKLEKSIKKTVYALMLTGVLFIGASIAAIFFHYKYTLYKDKYEILVVENFHMLENNIHSEDDKLQQVAIDHIKKSVEENPYNPNFKYFLGVIHLEGLGRNKVDYKEAWLALNDAKKRVIESFFAEKATKKIDELESEITRLSNSTNIKERLSVYPAIEAMAKRGDKKSQQILAALYLTGKDDYKTKDIAKAKKWEKKAAE